MAVIKSRAGSDCRECVVLIEEQDSGRDIETYFEHGQATVCSLGLLGTTHW